MMQVKPTNLVSKPTDDAAATLLLLLREREVLVVEKIC